MARILNGMQWNEMNEQPIKKQERKNPKQTSLIDQLAVNWLVQLISANSFPALIQTEDIQFN